MVMYRVRRDTRRNFVKFNPVLKEAETALEIDTENTKKGDGSTAYNDLPYEQGASSGGGSDPAAGKTQLLGSPTGEIESDATAVLIISGGGLYTVQDPVYDGQVIPIGIGDGMSTTITGPNLGSGDVTTTNGVGMFNLLAVDMTPLGGSGLAWFTMVPWIPGAAA